MLVLASCALANGSGFCPHPHDNFKVALFAFILEELAQNSAIYSTISMAARGVEWVHGPKLILAILAPQLPFLFGRIVTIETFVSVRVMYLPPCIS